jgi:hypothetical protein
MLFVDLENLLPDEINALDSTYAPLQYITVYWQN